MSKPTDEVISKIRKLMALSKSDNAGEAANAAAAVQRLMSRYAIDSAMLAEPEVGKPRVSETFVERLVFQGDGTIATWKLWLAGYVSRANYLKGVYSSSRTFHNYRFYGPAEDIEVAIELFNWLASEVERLELEARKTLAGKGAGVRYWNGFRNGAVQTIGTRLTAAVAEERRTVRAELTVSPEAYQNALQAGDANAVVELDRKAGQSGYALARLEDVLANVDKRPERIEHWQKKTLGLKTVKRPGRSLGNYAGYANGKRAGERASLKAGKQLPGDATFKAWAEGRD